MRLNTPPSSVRAETDMILNWLRVAVLLAFVSFTIGCGSPQPRAADKPAAREVRRPPQTGSYIPRITPLKTQATDRKSRSPKPKPNSTPKRERAKPEGKVDEDFVTRGGFR